MFFQFTILGHLVKHQFIVELCSVVFEISFYNFFLKSNNIVMYTILGYLTLWQVTRSVPFIKIVPNRNRDTTGGSGIFGT